jgi:hypothetical protein
LETGGLRAYGVFEIGVTQVWEGKPPLPLIAGEIEQIFLFAAYCKLHTSA